MLKKLVTGQLSLPMTFWGWGFCGSLLIGVVSKAGVYTGNVAIIPLSFLLRMALCCAVLSGIIFILRRKKTVLGILALLVVLVEIMVSAILSVSIFSSLFK